MTERLVRFEEMDALGVITLDRPQSANAVTPQVIADLTDAIGQAERSSIRALLLRAEGKNFCVGADLKHFSDRLDRLVPELASMADGFHAALARLGDLSIPFIVAVQGNAVGAGFGLVLAADVVIASSDARFSTGYARLGLSADAGVSLFLTNAVGPRLARSLLMSARFLDAAEAKALGLIDSHVPDEQLASEATAIAWRYADGPTAAYAAIKRLTAIGLTPASLRDHLALETDEILKLAADDNVTTTISGILKK